MSDKIHPVYLPKREVHYSSFVCFDTVPDLFECKIIDELYMSGIALTATLRIWQDQISKQVFWSEWLGEHNDEPKFDGKGSWNFWVIVPDNLEQFTHFIRGWGVQWWGGASELELDTCIANVTKAMETSPTTDQIFEWRRFCDYGKNEDFKPWWE